MKIQFCLRLILSALILCAYAQASAQSGPVVASDEVYRIHESSKNFRIIYAKEYENLIPEFAARTQDFLNRYEKEYNWSLDQRFDLVLASTENQIANGFVTSFPTLYSTYYNGAAEFMDEFASVSWLYDLTTHELAHVYQLNTKGEFGKILYSVLKNSTPGALPPFTYVIYPHLFTPTFLLEGNATFNEGRFGNGGRLHSGMYRALFLKLLAAGKVTSRRLMNEHLEWPYGAEKYVVGGYLQSHLAEEYSVQNTNNFFLAHARKEFFPFTINSSFEASFGVGYEAAIKAMKSKYSDLAKTQSSSKGTQVAKSQEHTSFTRNEGQITFMTTNLKSKIQVCQWSSVENKLCCESTRIPMGRAFKYENEWAAAAYQRVSPTSLKAGLYKNNSKPIKAFEGKYVFALDKDVALYADNAQSFKNVTIYKNKNFIGETQSTPFLSAAGDVYYFKQDKDGRHLYKNAELLTTVQGYYGKVVDVGPEQEVYFIASVERGSALFVFKNKLTYRAHPSDTIIDAMLTGKGQQILIAEIDSEGYKYKIDQLQVADFKNQDGSLIVEGAQPTFYTYKFDTPEDQANLQEPVTVENLQNIESDKNYQPFSEIQFAGIDTSLAVLDPDGFVGFFNFRFNDPLQRYLTSFSLRDAGWGSPGARISFTNAKHRLSYSFIADYARVPHITSSGSSDAEAELIGHSSEVTGLFGMTYPIFANRVWLSNLDLNFIYENENPDDKEVEAFVDNKDTNKAILSYDLAYSFSPGGLSYLPQQRFKLDLDAKVQGEKSAWKPKAHVYSGQFSFTQDIGWDIFVLSSYKAALSEGDLRGIELNNDSALFSLDPTEFNALGALSTSTYYQLRRVNAEIKRPIYFGLYHKSIPLGLWRAAPVAGYFEYYGSQVENKSVNTLFHQEYYGLEAELLLLHKFPVQVSYLSIKTNNETSNEFSLGLQQRF